MIQLCFDSFWCISQTSISKLTTYHQLFFKALSHIRFEHLGIYFQNIYEIESQGHSFVFNNYYN